MSIIKKSNNSISAALRNSVWNVYIGSEIKQSFCFCCRSEPITSVNFDCGHVQAKSKNGENRLHNLRPICGFCNSSMGTSNMEEFMKKCGFKKNDNWNGVNKEMADIVDYQLINVIDDKINIQDDNKNNVINNQNVQPIKTSIESLPISTQNNQLTKIKYIPSQTENSLKIFSLELEIKELREKYKELEEAIAIIINNTININIVSHGNENLIEKQAGRLILALAATNGKKIVQELILLIHFSPEFPEFQNIYLPDIYNDYIMVYDEGWMLKNATTVIKKLCDNISNFIINNIYSIFRYLIDDEKVVIEKWLTLMNDKNSDKYKKYYNKLLDKVKHKLFDNKNMVIATIKQSQLT